MEQTWSPYDQTVLGKIEIAPEVIEVIAGLAAVEVDGVRAMSGGFVGDLTEKLGRKNLRKGVRVDVEGQTVRVEVSVIVTYGVSIPQLAEALQRNVKQAIETMTSLTVANVSVYVTGVDLLKQD